ncbi:MAG TPA: adenosylmethionine--8-amino-7-oxononanoate transaminase [Chitinophagaceae bacterium]|nr:adenosylmethionine--8-amino-7-oxononanoate transaminase [Chitinophagaceae bacterium]
MNPQQPSLLQRDSQVIWHPFTQHKTTALPLPIVRGEGVYLFDERGNRYIDAISSWWTNLHGHAHPYLARKIHEQALQLEHVLFAGCTHEPAVSLAERVLRLLPGGFSRIFYSDNGSTSVEVAVKMAIQYHRNCGRTRRNRILALTHAYHGDTFGSMSVSGRSVFTEAFRDLLFEVHFIHLPELHEPDSFRLPEIDPEEVACLVYEPLVQGAGGMRMYQPAALSRLLAFCQANGILCIADEVMTGFGRTGKIFASEHVAEQPDLICLSKGLTGGSLPLAITACHSRVFEAFLSDDLHQTFFHGHSFTANPLACAAALASLDLLEDPACGQAIAALSARHQAFVQQLENSDFPRPVSHARSLGTILAFELHSDQKEYLDKVREETMEQALDWGVLLRPLGNTLYVLPPYCITGSQLDQVYEAILRILQRP